MIVLLTGANGQLGLSIKKLEKKYPQFQFIYTDIKELDITNISALHNYFEDNAIDKLINCAAYTAVDKAEKEPELARLINVEAAENLAKCSNKYNFTLFHISTDYVFNGENFSPYKENDSPNPTSIYGQTKYLGEQAVIRNSKDGVIIRTSWLYSEFGNNFLKTMLRLAREKDEVNIISDQIGTPTYAGELAKAILEMISTGFSEASLFHFSNEGVASWYDFSKEIIDLSGSTCKVNPIFTHEYPLPAKRPFYSLLNKRKFTSRFKYTIPHWKESLKVCLGNLDELE